MQTIARRTLREFWEAHPSAEAPLLTWYALGGCRMDWSVRCEAMFGSADFAGGNWVIFNIGGNKYRLIDHIAYAFRRVLVKFIGTHAEYNKINAETV
jgi:mRNA interferase HigB